MRPKLSRPRPSLLSVEHGERDVAHLSFPLSHLVLLEGSKRGGSGVGTLFRQFWFLLPLVQVCPEFQFMIFGPKRSSD